MTDVAILEPGVLELGECRHGLMLGTCSLCSGREAITAPDEPRVHYGPMRARRPALLALVDRVAAGTACAECHGDTAGGCRCVRRGLYWDHLDAIVREVVELYPPDEVSRSERATALAIARSAITRAARRAGVSLDDAAADFREKVRDLYEDGSKAGWYRPRVNHPTHLPV